MRTCQNLTAQRQPSRPIAGATSSSRSPASAILSLQRKAGNRAVAAVLATPALPVIQRKEDISAPDFDMVHMTLTLLLPHKAGLKELAEDSKLLKQVSLKYGLGDMPEYDQYRPKKIPSKVRHLVDAGRSLRAEMSGSPVTGRAVNGDFNEDDLQARLGPDLSQVLDHVADVWPRFTALYSARPDGKLVVLPTADVIAKAPGKVGKTLRELAAPSFAGHAITAGEVKQIYDAYNKDPWRYDPASSPSAHALILGQITTAVCGAFAGALVEMVNLVAQARGVPNPAAIGSHQGRFVTIPYQWGYIDPKVKGNIEAIEDGPSGYAKVNRASFTTHTWMTAHGHVYDPLGRKRDTDFNDHTIGALETGKDGIVAANDNWELVLAAKKPPAGFVTGYRLRKVK